MNHLFIPYDLAKKLKEKGFDEICHALIDEDKCIHPLNLSDKMDLEFDQQVSKYNDKECCPAPMLQQAIDWFDSQGVFIVIYQCDKGEKFNFHITLKGESGSLAKEAKYRISQPTRYEATNNAIEMALTLI